MTLLRKAVEANPFAALVYDSDDEDDDLFYEPDLAAVGAGAMAGNVTNTSELRPMKFNEAMKTKDQAIWKKAIKDEYHRFVKNEVFKVVHMKDVPKGTHVMTNTWTCKKKANGTFRARLDMRGFD